MIYAFVSPARDDSAVPGGAQSPDLRSPHGRGGTSSNEKDANKAQTKDDEQWSMTCEDGINELTTDDSEKRGTKKVKPVVLKEGENIEINSRKFKLCGAMMGNYGFVEIVEESKVPFYLHYESTINCKKKKLKVHSVTVSASFHGFQQTVSASIYY
ncbi:hypothetical protein Tcan_10606 [Toxocara canis]|uniref:Uncharacterized protein n=1 Tax=Toxocara canis TaxID=6265 RepID=A0A0B2UU90_TOXCA|nr:hypothetical protein Tcan_10606 [Toxocara canis]